jgi:NADH:ubiquinone oxidoreductase subunit 3 (subunit A)
MLLTEVTFTVLELVTAFILILATSFMIYLFGRWFSPRSIQDGDGKSTYTCGEKAIFHKLKINVSLYKYLIYFAILDSSVLLVAYASLALHTVNVLLFILYLSIVFVSGFLLFEGGDQ